MDRLRHQHVPTVLAFLSILLRFQVEAEFNFSKCNYSKEIFGVLIESWSNINNLNEMNASSLKAAANVQNISSLDSPRDPFLRNTGQRLRTYFLTPQTGNYTFYLACDDSCELHLSTDESPDNTVTLVTIISYTSFQDWSNLNAKEVTLTERRSYFLEVIHVQNGGAYHVSVGLKFPDGTYSRPVANKYLVKYEPGMYGEAPPAEWGQWSQCNTTSGKGEQKRRRYCQDPVPVYSRLSSSVNHTEIRVCSVPVSSIHVNRTSSTSLLVTWYSEWQDRWPSDLQGFKVFYNESHGSTKNITVGSSETLVLLQDLAIYSLYCIRIVLVTVTGDGPPSPCVTSSTGQDVPCSFPLGLTSRSNSSPYKIRAMWQALPQLCWHGVPRGYSLRLKVFRSAHDDNSTWSREVRVEPSFTGIQVEGLQTFTTYSLQVAALTDIGHGPYSHPILVDTCRCPRRFLVNWLQAPPLCFTSQMSNVTVPLGILPARLQAMINHACGTCHGHQRTEIIYKKRNTSVQEILSSLTHHLQLTLPISLSPQMPFVRSEWVFLPMIELAGIAFVTKKPTAAIYASHLASSFLRCWAVFVVLIVIYVTFGLVIWVLESKDNPTQFPQPFSRGWKNGVWWAFVSMTTVGYGRHYPRSVAGRIFGIASLLVGVILNALFVGALTSSLTVFVVNEQVNPEQGAVVGVVSGTVEHHLAMRMNGSKGVTFLSFPLNKYLLDGLHTGKLDGALVDVLTAEPFLKDLNNSDYVVSKIVSRPFFYGIILTGDARYLLRDFQEFLSTITIEKPVKSRKPPRVKMITPRITEPTTAVQEETISFFDPENVLYQQTVKITGVALLAILVSGILYQFAGKWISRSKGPPRTPLLKTNEIRAEMRQLLEEFHSNFRQRYITLKEKHKLQVMQLERQRRVSSVAVRSTTEEITL